MQENEEAIVFITGFQARAARALVQMPVEELARLAGIDASLIIAFERGASALDDKERDRLWQALEESGAAFIPEDNTAGFGVRLKHTRSQVRAINRWEGEGGQPGEDDV